MTFTGFLKPCVNEPTMAIAPPTITPARARNPSASRFTSYVNPQLAISLASTYVYPDSVAWQAGTRTVICEARATSGELTGSVTGSSASVG